MNCFRSSRCLVSSSRGTLERFFPIRIVGYLTFCFKAQIIIILEAQRQVLDLKQLNPWFKFLQSSSRVERRKKKKIYILLHDLSSLIINPITSFRQAHHEIFRLFHNTSPSNNHSEQNSGNVRVVIGSGECTYTAHPADPQISLFVPQIAFPQTSLFFLFFSFLFSAWSNNLTPTRWDLRWKFPDTNLESKSVLSWPSWWGDRPRPTNQRSRVDFGKSIGTRSPLSELENARFFFFFWP